jgi:hypothetical protein
VLLTEYRSGSALNTCSECARAQGPLALPRQRAPLARLREAPAHVACASVDPAASWRLHSALAALAFPRAPSLLQSTRGPSASAR